MSEWLWAEDHDDEESSLPEPDYESRDGPPWWDYVWPDDDRSEWERDVRLRACRRCRRREVVDPLGRCVRCRVAAGCCSWCGLAPTVYQRAEACRTCYQWIRRNGRGLELDVLADRLLTAAERRHARWRRDRVPKRNYAR